MRSTSPGRRRRWRWLAVLAAVGVAAAFGTTVLSARGGTSPRNPCDVAGAKRTGITGPVTPPSTGHVPPISTRHLETQRSSVEDTTGTVRYSVDSAFCGALTIRGVATVFRNSDGALVGGSFARDNSKDRCRPGRYTESTDAFRSIPPGIDDSRTESYPYCDPDPTGGNPTATEEPVN